MHAIRSHSVGPIQYSDYQVIFKSVDHWIIFGSVGHLVDTHPPLLLMRVRKLLQRTNQRTLMLMVTEICLSSFSIPIYIWHILLVVSSITLQLNVQAYNSSIYTFMLLSIKLLQSYQNTYNSYTNWNFIVLLARYGWVVRVALV